ncbi:MAG TPA: hypothetical protein VEB21_00085 [Terriglobales bacterium]|nr:hypothetical protein [Terriglobales bacterium]
MDSEADGGSGRESPLYPNRQAFLVRLRRTGESSWNELAGRIEHPSSGRTLPFANVEELIERLRQVLREEVTGGGKR